jgi:hypothetical protein
MLNTEPQYEVHVHLVDVIVALRCEADRAEREQFPGVAKRQRDLALHLENAELQLNALPHPGYRLEATVTYRFVPVINAHLKPEFR